MRRSLAPFTPHDFTDPILAMSATADSLMTSVSDGMSEAISLSRFKQALLGVTHENQLLERRARDLESRMHEEAKASKARLAEVADLQQRLDDAIRKGEKAYEAAGAQQKAAEDERSRHDLRMQLASEKAEAAQNKLRQQGQQLYSLEDQLRARTDEASRLRIEKVGADDLISSFQGRLEEVSRVIEATAKAEQACKNAIKDVRADQDGMRQRLGAAESAQRAAVPRAHLEQLLKAALRDVQDARDQAAGEVSKRESKERELAVTRAELARATEGLSTSRMQAQASHTRELAAEEQRRSLVTQLQAAQSHMLQLREKSDSLMRKLDQSKALVQLLLREVSQADANAHEASTGAALAAQAADERVHVAEECMHAKTRQLALLTEESHVSRDELRCQAVAMVALKEEALDVRHRLALLEASQAASTPCTSSAGVSAAPATQQASESSEPAPVSALAAAPPVPATPILPSAQPLPQASPLPGPPPLQSTGHLGPQPLTSRAPCAPGQPPRHPPASWSSSVHASAGATSSSPAPPPELRPLPPPHPAWVEEEGAGGECPCAPATDAVNAVATEGNQPSSSPHRYHPITSLAPAPLPAAVSAAPDRPACPSSASQLPAAPSEAHPAPPASVAGSESAFDVITSAENRTCAVCSEVLYGAAIACCKCGASFHAVCAKRGAQQVHKSFTCEACHMLAKRTAEASGLAGTAKRAKTKGKVADFHKRALSAMV